MENTVLQPAPTTPPEENKKQPETKSSPPSNRSLIILAIIIGIVGLGLIVYFVILPYFKKEPSTPTPPASGPITNPNIPPNPSNPSSPITPAVNEPPIYTTLEQEFPNLVNNKTGLFSSRAKELLKKNGFVVVPAENEEFFSVYKTNQDQHTPNFITTDSFLHSTHLIFKHLGQNLNNKKDSTADFLNGVIEQLKLETVSAVHLPAAFGAPTAEKILSDEGRGIPKAPSLDTTSTNPRVIGVITAGIDEYDISFLFPLVQTKPGNLPDFMKNEGWGYKAVNTFLGSWTELISTSVHQIPVVMAEGTGGNEPETEAIDERGYVEPEPKVYERISELTKETRLELEKNKKLSAPGRTLLISLEKTALTLKAISESEINKIPLTEEAHQFIIHYPDWLETVWKQVYSVQLAKNNGGTLATLAQNPSATLANAALLSKSNSTLQVGTGKVFDIFVIVTVNGKQKLARGGVYSYYEFMKPATERLIPSAWRELISNTLNSLPPDLPKWTNNFIDLSAVEITK